jgi:7-carboxy-7-deazaguanine synthase
MPLPVSEIFGPTIQGEGPLAGLPCYFIRFAGCDFKCRWCDSRHAVLPLPGEVRMMTEEEIFAELLTLQKGPGWVVFTGGNPCRQELGKLVELLIEYKIQVETQGTAWRNWLRDTDLVVVSPKAPSSGHKQTPFSLSRFDIHLDRDQLAFKVVVFNEEDLQYARKIHATYPRVPFYLSCGTIPTRPVGDCSSLGEPDTSTSRAGRYRWLCESVAGDAVLRDVRVLPQLHVYAWGEELGR